jgi:hypothetical protein
LIELGRSCFKIADDRREAMRRGHGKLWISLLAGLVAIVAISMAAYAGSATKQGSETKPTGTASYKKPRGKEFVHPSPAFSVMYPRYVEEKPLEVETEILRLADKSGLPTFVVSVSEYTGGDLKDMPPFFFEALKTDPRYAEKTRWKLEYENLMELPDGTPAVELEVGWDWTPGFRLFTTYVATVHGEKIITYTVTSTEKGNTTLKKYLYSMTLQ